MKIRFRADADLRSAIIKAVRHLEPDIDFELTTAQPGAGDAEVLEEAAVDNRILVSHDRHTMIEHFRDRLATGQSSPGLLIVPQDAPLGAVAESLAILWTVGDPAELRNQIYHLPSLSRHVFRR